MSSRLRVNDKPFEMVMLNGRSAASFFCTACPETLTVPNISNVAVPVILDRVRVKGWLCPDFGRRNVLCPACAIRKPKPVNDVDAELRKFTDKQSRSRQMAGAARAAAGAAITPGFVTFAPAWPTPLPPPAAPLVIDHEPPPPPPPPPPPTVNNVTTPKEPVMAEPIKLTPPAPSPAPVSIHPLSASQRLAIRSALDRHFDDEKGRYLGGQSDRTIAEAVGVPALHVKAIREMAYGEIKADPELLELQASAAELHRKLRDLEERLARLVAQS